MNSSSRAYPRWRGGNVETDLQLTQQQGLSPLARGKLQVERIEPAALGPIPAGAGETEIEIE